MTGGDWAALKATLIRLRSSGPAVAWIPAGLDRVVETTQSLPGVDEVTLALVGGDGRLGAVAVSRPAAMELPARQSDLGQGPSLLALQGDETFVSADAINDPSWPALAPVLRELGVGAVLSAPVRLRSRPAGVLELTAREPHAYSTADIDAAGTVADVVAELLEAIVQAEEQRGLAGQLEYALTTRVLIEQAKGVLMAQTDLAESEAFDHLRRTARSSRLTVAEVARTVLANRHGPAGRGNGGAAALEALSRLTVVRMPATELLVAVLEPVRALVGADVAAILVPSDRDGELEGFARPGPGPARAVRLRVPAGAGLSGQVMLDSAPRLIPQAVRPDPAFPGVPVRSAAAVPLSFGGQPFGALLAARTGDRPLTPAELHRLQLAAARIGPAAVGARLDELQAKGRAGERAALDRLRRLQGVTAALSGALTPAEVARVVVEEGVRALRANGGVAAVVTPERILEVIASAGYDASVVEQHLQMPLDSEMPLAVAASQGRSVWIGSAEEHHRRFPATRGLLANEATASIPLVVDDTTLGVLGFSFDTPQCFDEDARLFITALANQCAQALERARLFEEAGRERLAAVAERDRLAFLVDASGVLASSLDESVILDQIVWLAVPRIADIGSVLLVEDGELRQGPMACANPDLKDKIVELMSTYPDTISAAGPAEQIRAAGAHLLTAEQIEARLAGVPMGETHLRLMREVGYDSALMVPLAGRRERLGLIAFIRLTGRAPFDETDVPLIEDLAARAGIALDNARRFGRAVGQ